MSSVLRHVSLALVILIALYQPAGATDLVLCRNGASGTKLCPVPLAIGNLPVGTSSSTVAAGNSSVTLSCTGLSGCGTVALGGTLSPSVSYGTTSGTATQGNDSRLPPTPSATGRIVYDNGSAWTALAAGASSQLLHGGTTPSWGAVNLATETTGTLPLGALAAHASTHLQGGADPILGTGNALSSDTTLTASDRYVWIDGPAIITLPTSPPNGTEITLTARNGLSTMYVTIQRGGANTIYSQSSPLYLSLGAAAITLKYRSGDWSVFGFAKRTINFHFDSATAGQYLQPATAPGGGGAVTWTGGALSSAQALGLLTGTLIWGNLTCQTRTATSGVQAISICPANSDFAFSQCGSGSYVEAVFSSGSTFAVAQAFNLTSSYPGNTAKTAFVARASVANLNTPVDCQFSYWTI